MTPFLYQCTTCGKLYHRDEVRYLCPDCAKDYRPGIPLVGVLSAQFDYAAIRKRFKKASPDWSLFSAVEDKHYPPYPCGNTPYFKAAALGQALGSVRMARPPYELVSDAIPQRLDAACPIVKSNL